MSIAEARTAAPRSERAAHIALQPATDQAEARLDWSMRQFVEDARMQLARGVNHAQLEARLHARGVPEHVRRRVLAGA